MLLRKSGSKSTQAILRIAEEKRLKTREKCWNPESQVLVALCRRGRQIANFAFEWGSGGFSPGKIFRNSRPFSAKFFNGKSLKGGFFWDGTRISGQSSQWEGDLGVLGEGFFCKTPLKN